MTHRMSSILVAKRNSIWLVGFAVLIAFAGCKNKKLVKAKTQPAETKTQKASTETTSVKATTTPGIESPAAVSNQPPSPETSPADVCQQFMDHLQSGNRISAENLLTKIALTITTKEGLKLEPMGGPSSRIQFGDVRFATNKQKLAQVDCTVLDVEDGEEYTTELTWVCRKQSQGWRISGMMVQLEPGAYKDFLSFENLQDVQQMKLLAGTEVINDTAPVNADTPPESRQAQVTHTSGPIKN